MNWNCSGCGKFIEKLTKAQAKWFKDYFGKLPEQYCEECSKPFAPQEG